MMQPKAVIWDIGNVLLDWSPDRLYRQVMPDPAARAAFFARYPFDEMNLDGDRGSLLPVVEAMASKYPEDAAMILMWWAGWDRMCGGLLEDSLAIRDRLRAAGVPCWALTNFAADTWPRAERLYPSFAAFDGVVVSGREGVVKPDDRIFEITEARTGLTGADLFFIDDRTANITAAKARGWRGHVFENAAGLEAALAEVGLGG
jgi:2-haloacid dehalogenase